jgi:hypothetical protein
MMSGDGDADLYEEMHFEYAPDIYLGRGGEVDWPSVAEIEAFRRGAESATRHAEQERIALDIAIAYGVDDGLPF